MQSGVTDSTALDTADTPPLDGAIMITTTRLTAVVIGAIGHLNSTPADLHDPRQNESIAELSPEGSDTHKLDAVGFPVEDVEASEAPAPGRWSTGTVVGAVIGIALLLFAMVLAGWWWCRQNIGKPIPPPTAEPPPSFIPEDWTDQSEDHRPRNSRWWTGGAKLVTVTPTSQQVVWDMISAKFHDSIPRTQATIDQIQRWEHRSQFRKFWDMRRMLDTVKRFRNGGANEKLLWHGTGTLRPADALCNDVGLDNRFSRGGFYGNGLYLAEKARYSNSDYAHRLPEIAGQTPQRQLILVRASVGRYCDYGWNIDRTLQLPPAEPGRFTQGKRYDSVRGGPHRPKTAGPGDNDSVMFVLYDYSLFYAEYVVTYHMNATTI
jgi:hypothetical protein